MSKYICVYISINKCVYVNTQLMERVKKGKIKNYIYGSCRIRVCLSITGFGEKLSSAISEWEKSNKHQWKWKTLRRENHEYYEKKIRRRVKKINKRLHRNCVHSELNR